MGRTGIPGGLGRPVDIRGSFGFVGVVRVVVTVCVVTVCVVVVTVVVVATGLAIAQDQETLELRSDVAATDPRAAEYLAALVAGKTELAVVLGERTVLDVLTAEEPIAFTFERTGRLEKLQAVLLTRRGDWEKLLPGVERDPKLTQKPASVARQPDKRPFSDPRPFLPQVGQPVKLVLRNGIQAAMLLIESQPDLAQHAWLTEAIERLEQTELPVDVVTELRRLRQAL